MSHLRLLPRVGFTPVSHPQIRARLQPGEPKSSAAFRQRLERGKVAWREGDVSLVSLPEKVVYSLAFKTLGMTEKTGDDKAREDLKVSYGILRAELERRGCDKKWLDMLEHVAVRSGVTEKTCFCGRKGLYIHETAVFCSKHRDWARRRHEHYVKTQLHPRQDKYHAELERLNRIRDKAQIHRLARGNRAGTSKV